MGKLFGTDGIRGLANIELTPEMAFRMGRVAATVLSRTSTGTPAFLVARDTRISGEMLEAALVAGLTSAGADVHLAGVISTPAAAFLTRQSPYCGGVVISASHNPYPDNGIKFINNDGFKLPDDREEEMESLYHQEQDSLPRPQAAQIGRVHTLSDAVSRYTDYLVSTVPCRFHGYRVVLDCANGAAYQLAPAAFRALGAEVITLHDSPDGLNINHSCGSTHPEAACAMVHTSGAPIGFSFDGDADRVLAIDEQGSLVDGDAIMAVLALSLQEKGLLKNNTLVATVMSNIGLEKAAAAHGITLLRARVGDRYVLEEMLSGGHNLGGEQSGHIIMLDQSTTGDGLLTALQLMAVMVQNQKPLSALISVFSRYPQVLVNCRVRNKEGLSQNPRVAAAIQKAETALAGTGRLLVRPSGTEPLVRIMLEGQNEDQLHKMAREIADVVEKELA
jgi:phosphoglucosamine mutase